MFVSSTTAGDSALRGQVAELRVWRCSRRDAELATAMNQRLPLSTPDLVASSSHLRSTAANGDAIKWQGPAERSSKGAIKTEACDLALTSPEADAGGEDGDSRERGWSVCSLCIAAPLS